MGGWVSGGGLGGGDGWVAVTVEGRGGEGRRGEGGGRGGGLLCRSTDSPALRGETVQSYQRRQSPSQPRASGRLSRITRN